MKERFESVRKMTVAWRKGDVTKISAYIYIYIHTHTHTHTHAHITLSDTYIYIFERVMCVYTGCPRRNGQNFGRVSLMWNYTDITQNTYIQS